MLQLTLAAARRSQSWKSDGW